MRLRCLVAIGLIAALWMAQPALAQSKTNAQGTADDSSTDSFAEIVADLDQRAGLLTFYVDSAKGKIWLELPAGISDEPIDLLYVEGLLSGLGSNPVGLDRGQLGGERLVRLRRLAGKLLIEHRNLGFRASSSNALEVLAVERSFATSVLWAGEIEAEAADGRSLVDLTSFLVRDAHGVSNTLKRAGQGSFKLDAARSAVDPEACLAFPDNIEFEALLTFGGTEPGSHVRQTAPTAEAITLVQHHSFIRLPDEGYTPRRFDPRAGSFAIRFADYATGLDQPLVKRWIVRHRLEKTDPSAARSPVVEPIVYYVDSGAPPQIQQALIEGASWWADAFDAAGFIDAFRVEILPADAHPLDVRYNVVQWVHRSTRGWSYGGGITDPRTGEMIKGHVSLGSLRVRQDRLIFEGLAGTDKTGSGAADDPVEIALARIRQLSAHEVGHTLGFTHNFAASTYGRASVMDYPAPLITLGSDGSLDFSQAYGVGVGEWDKHTVRYAYSQFPPGTDEAAELEKTVQEAADRRLLFVADADARPDGAAHPYGHLWDNGTDPVAELERLMAVRQTALGDFDETRIAAGQPLSLLHETLVPIYLLHRFQIRAAVNILGGLDYSYGVRGDEGNAAELLDPAWQRQALSGLLDVLEPQELDIPESLLAILLPRPFGFWGNRELFGGATSPAFDSLGVAATVSDMVVDLILQPERMARLVDHHRRDEAQPSLEEVLDTVIARTFEGEQPSSAREAELERVAQAVVAARLLELGRFEDLPARVRSRVDAAIARLDASLSKTPGDETSRAHRTAMRESISRYRERREPAPVQGVGTLGAPPGQPIGSGSWRLDEASGCSWSDWPRTDLPKP